MDTGAFADMETEAFVDIEHALEGVVDTSMPEEDKSKTLIRQVFIPDLLRYIARFLGDDVPIRFVCKQAHDNLSGVQSSMALVFKSEGEERDKNAREKARPYVTSVSMLQWARETLAMPWGTNICYAPVMGGNLDVVTWLRSHEREVFPWDFRVCAYAAENGHLDVLKWLRAQDPPCPWDAHVCNHAAQYGHLDVLQWFRAQEDRKSVV